MNIDGTDHHFGNNNNNKKKDDDDNNDDQGDKTNNSRKHQQPVTYKSQLLAPRAWDCTLQEETKRLKKKRFAEFADGNQTRSLSF